MELHARADRVHKQYQAAAYAEVVRELPELFTAADEAYATGYVDRGAVLAYVSEYVVGAKLLAKVGSGELAKVTADRSAVVAGATDSPAAQGPRPTRSSARSCGPTAPTSPTHWRRRQRPA